MKPILALFLLSVVALLFSSCSGGLTDRVEVPTYTASKSKLLEGVIGRDKHGMPTYAASMRNRYVRTTAYSCQENEKGAHGLTSASGARLKYGGHYRSAAADWSKYPVGTEFQIRGLPYTYIVEDYGRALVGTNTIDLYFPNMGKMRYWGRRNVEIKITKWGSPTQTLAILKGRTRYWHCRHMYNAMKVRARAFYRAM